MKSQQTNPIPIPANASVVERWWLIARGQTFRQMPIESAFSLPVPIWVEDRLCMAAFYYGVRRGEVQFHTQATTILAHVTATYPDCRILGFIHRDLQELFPNLQPNGYLGELVSGGPEEGRRILAARRKLFSEYDSVLEGYRSGKVPAEARKSFHYQFLATAENPLIPYYRALNPEFFSWLES